MSVTTIWTVENGVPVAYERKGECNGCGKCCCQHTISFEYRVRCEAADRDKGKSADEEWSESEGWHLLYHHGVWWYFKITGVEETGKTCPCLDDGNKCAVWMDERDFPPICRYWPFHPSNLEQYPECSFTFEHVEEVPA